MIRFGFALLTLITIVNCGGVSNQKIGSTPLDTPGVCPEPAAGQVCLQWDRPADPRIIGYRVYVGPSPRNYTVTWDVGDVDTTVVRNLQSGELYYFAVTSRASGNMESAYSNEVSKTMPSKVKPILGTIVAEGMKRVR